MKTGRLPNAIRYIGINLIVACSYFIFGYIGTLLASPPSHASPVWPASGLALAVALACGKRIIPGLFIGILAIQIYAFLDFSLPENLLPSLISGTLSCIGSLTQAFLGVYLINHYVGKQNPLIKDKKIFNFFLYGGFISCLVAPTIGVTTIYFQGFITANDLPISWLTWWIGDVIGVLIFTPIILSLIAKPAHLWKGRRKSVGFPLFFAFVLVVSIFQYNQKQEIARITSIFEQQVNIFSSAFNTEVQHHVEVNEMLKGFYDSSQKVTKEEFASLTQPFLKKFKSIQALEWVSFVPKKSRHQFENKEHFGVMIREPNQQKEMISAASRDEYFPITFVQPYKGNERALGFDIGTTPSALIAIHKARDTGETAITTPLQLIQDLKKKMGFVLYSPVYLKQVPTSSITERINALEGFVAGVFRAEDEINEVFSEFPNLHLLIKIDDSGHEFYSNFPKSNTPNYNFFSLHKVSQLAVANRIWTITYQPSADFYHNQISWTLWWILLGGLVTTALTGMGLLMLTGRTLRTEDLVRIRTHDLAISEERFHTIFSEAPLGVAVIDSFSGLIYDANPAYELITGRSLEELRALDWVKITHPDDRQKYLDNLTHMNAGELSGFTIQKRYIQPNESICWVNITITLMALKNKTESRYLCMTEDITDRKLSELREEYRSTVLESIASGLPLPRVLKTIVKSVERLNPSMLCSILVLDEEGKHLMVGAAPSLPEFYNKAIHGIEIGDSVGSCGTAAYSGNRVIVSDIQTHPYWASYKQLAEKARLASCWSEPILSTIGDVIGTFAIYHHDIHSPTDADILVIEQTAALASIAIEQNNADKALKQSEERWQFALEGSRDGVWDWNIESNEVFFSKRFKEMLGFKANEISNHLDEWDKRIHPDDKERVYADIKEYFNHNVAIYENEYRMLCKDGSYQWRLSRGKVVSWSEDNKPIRMIGTLMDITGRKLAEEKMQLSAKVFSETNEGISITNAEAIIIDVNPAYCEITGYTKNEVIGKNPSIVASGKHTPDFYSTMWQAISKRGYWQGEVWNRKKDGKLYAELLSISSILDKDNVTSHYVGIFTDITHIKKQQETLEQIAHYDVLTQLPNRVLLADRFTQALAHSIRQESLLAVCFLDLDNFKPVNDIYGHEAGDQLLVEVAERIKSIIREEDTVSRQGGDEFVLLLGDIESFTQCEQMLKRIIESLAQPYVIDEQSISISASIGVSLYPIDNSDLDTLMRHADQAMYQSKLAGRNRYSLFNTEEDEQNVQKNIKFKEIQDALENNELCLYYQPKVNMATGGVFGVEALIRWNHPERGLVPPLEFLPIIEATELEIQVGNWVINEALTQLEEWQERSIELEVSVNISSYHLVSPLFIENLEKVLSLHPKIYSKSLQLEILESSALGDITLISNIIKTCIHALGVRIALDDFGTGYSSLTHLRNLPTEVLKIDQTFVRDMLDDPSDYAIIDSVIGLSDSFDREVIAEGVETTQHGLMLLAMGCNNAQGYGIARPMPELEIPDWLDNYTPNHEWLDYANKSRSDKENKLKLFRLTVAQWQKTFENNVQASLDSNRQWPILIRTKCHCGVWIKRARQEKLFEENSLKKLEKAHNTMHDIADDLFEQYKEGNIKKARDGLNDLSMAVEHISNILGQCE